MAAVALRDFISQNFNSRDVVCVFLMHAARHMERLGISMRIDAEFDRLLKVNKENRHHKWFSVMPMFDPRYAQLDSFERGFWLEGLSRDGKTVVAQSARRYNLPQANLRNEIETLSFFYSDPDTQKGEGEQCACTAPAAEYINLRVCYSGGTWVHPDYRGRELAAMLPRISRSLSLLLWDTDFTISLVDPILIEKGVVRRYGYTRVERGVAWRGNPGQGDLDLALIWMDRPELLSDLHKATEIAVQDLV